jgi:hypothetical protein
MAMPDIGVGPPPPPDVSAQMRPTSSVSSNGGPDLGALMAQLAGGQMPTGPDITPKVLDVQPLLSQIARQVPSLGPDVDRLNVELKAHMAGLPNAIAQMGAGSGGPAPGASGAPGPPAQAAAPQGAASTPAALTSQMGAMDTAMQLEVKLPSIGKDDPTLMPYIQGFIARMRDEVPKVVQGDTEAISPPPQPAPTDAMLSKIPVSF